MEPSPKIVNGSMTSPSSSTPIKPTARRSTSILLRAVAGLGSLLCLFTVAAMSVAHVGLLSTVYMDHMYQRYYRPLIARLERTADHDAVRRTDSTYYRRACTSLDLSATTADELVLERPISNNIDEMKASYVDHMMTHGVAIIPNAMPQSIAERLYQYVLKRNAVLTEEESIRINPNFRREAFAFDPAEDPIVTAAVDALVQNDDLKALIHGVTGDDDPALMELTAITSYEGAQIQNWHHDVLPHRGSAVQYARTYGYSFSLFIALQDTYSLMGATRICPGTHLCGEDQSEMCDEHGFQPLMEHDDGDNSSDAESEPYWKRGDAVLFNQQLAHHGEAHTEGPPRVMMVISFTTRPQLAIDHRVLSAGLFSFSLWNIWGLTWQDLYLNVTHTANPWYRKLRSIGMWKPASAHWGLDFVTKSIMEWNMGENGMEPTRLVSYAKRLHRYIGLPSFLQGRVIEIDEDEEEDIDEDPYHVYLTTTFQTWFDTFVKMNVALATVFLMVYAALATCFVQHRTRKPIVGIAVVVYALPTLALFGQLRRIQQSEWGQNVLNGIIFREPFPAVRPLGKLYKELDNADEKAATTMPDRTDVLIATRLASPYLGSMTQWIDYHPGNVAYRSAIRHVGSYFGAYRGLPLAFQDSLIDHVVDANHRGRMLQQDWQTGFWRIMDTSSRRQQTARDMVRHSNPQVALIAQTLDVLLSRSRFEVSFRESALAYHAQLLVLQLNRLLVSSKVDSVMVTASPKLNRIIAFRETATRASSAGRSLRRTRRLASIQPQTTTSSSANVRPSSTGKNHSRWTTMPVQPFRVGDSVLAKTADRGWVRATILTVHEREDPTATSNSTEQMYDIGYEWGEDEEGTPLHELQPPVYIESGGRAVKCPRENADGSETMADAIIKDIQPDMGVDIIFVDNGQVHEDVDMNSCYRKFK